MTDKNYENVNNKKEMQKSELRGKKLIKIVALVEKILSFSIPITSLIYLIIISVVFIMNFHNPIIKRIAPLVILMYLYFPIAIIESVLFMTIIYLIKAQSKFDKNIVFKNKINSIISQIIWIGMPLILDIFAIFASLN